MTVLCAIADCPPDAIPAPLRGVGGGAPVAILGPAQEDVWEHERTVSELMDLCAILPARFDTQMSEEQAASFVRCHEDELRAALSRVRGAVEVGVRARLADVEGPPADAGPGATYLLGLRDRARAAQRIEGWLEPLSALSRAHVPTPGSRTDAAVRHSYLVDRDTLARFVDRVAALDAEHPECELVCTGPWPPYSFTEALP